MVGLRINPRGRTCAAQSGSQRLLTSGPHTTHRAGSHWVFIARLNGPLSGNLAGRGLFAVLVQGFEEVIGFTEFAGKVLGCFDFLGARRFSQKTTKTRGLVVAGGVIAP